MRFLPNGPNIPIELVAAQERGQTIFVCGAGVSHTVGLPLFRGLVENVYQEPGEDWNLSGIMGVGIERAVTQQGKPAISLQLLGEIASVVVRMAMKRMAFGDGRIRIVKPRLALL